MPSDDPFAGLKLSSQAAPGRLDQRLFDREDGAPKPAAPPSTPPAKVERSAPAPKPDVPKPAPPARPILRPASLTRSNLRLMEQPLYKATFVFTQEELEVLEDLKLELRRQLDSKVTKYDLIRTGLHMLAEDYTTNGEKSYVYRKIRKR